MTSLGFSYENFCSAEEVEVFKRVKRRQMNLANAARQVCSDLVGGVIGDGKRSDKEFINTRFGQYRLALGGNSDNSTEEATHNRMGVVPVWMGDWDDIRPWFRKHDCTVSYEDFIKLIRAELDSRGDDGTSGPTR